MNILIIFGSSRGRTKKIALLIKEELEEKLFISSIDLRDIKDGLSGITNYDILLLGSSTWDSGDLQRDFYKREKDFLSLNLKGKKGACFGAASILYPYYGEAIDILENMAKKVELEILLKRLVVDDLEKDPTLLVKEWCLSFIEKINP